MMPPSTQNLYFHLGMNADDDGFVEHFTVMRMTESRPDDLRILHARNYVKIFDDKVLIIMDWNENNYIRADRYTPSRYLEIYKDELKCLPSGIPTVDPEYGIPVVDPGKDRIGKDSLVKDKENIMPSLFPSEMSEQEKHDRLVYKEIIDYLNQKTSREYKYTSKATQKHINARLKEGYSVDDFKKVIDVKCSQWLNDCKMTGYLRPETLFGTKFEGYLQEKIKVTGAKTINDETEEQKRKNEERTKRMLAPEPGVIYDESILERI